MASLRPGVIWTSLYDYSVIGLPFFFLLFLLNFLNNHEAYMDLLTQAFSSQILERMDDTVPRAPDIMRLPIQSVNYGLDLLRDLHFAKQEVPDVLRRFIGAYRQSNRSSLLLLSNSLFNKEGKIYRQISQDRLLKFSKEWFANLVMKAAFSFLDSALVMWNSMRSGSHCIIFSATSSPLSSPFPTSS